MRGLHIGPHLIPLTLVAQPFLSLLTSSSFGVFSYICMYPPLYPPRLTLGSATSFNPDVGLDVPRSHCAPFVIALKFAHVFFRRCTSSLWASLPSSFLGLFLHTCRHLIRLFWECVFFLPPTAFHVIFSLVGRLPLFIFSLCIHFVNGKIARI